MYKQIKKSIQYTLLTVAILLLVTEVARASLIYEWVPGDGAAEGSSGTIELACDVWDNSYADETEVLSLTYYDGTVTWVTSDIDYFYVDLIGDEMVLLMIDGDLGPEMYVDEHGNHYDPAYGTVSTDVWVVQVWEWTNLSYDDIIYYNGSWEKTGDCNPVPEPATLSLLGIGLVGLIGGAARKKLKKKAIAKT